MAEDLKLLYKLMLNYNYYVFTLDKTYNGSVVITLRHEEAHTWPVTLTLEPQELE